MTLKKTWIGVAVLALFFGQFAGRAMAWGSKEHMLLTRLAILRLLDDAATPPAMKDWLKTLQPDLGDLDHQKDFFLHTAVGAESGKEVGMSWWVVQPDVRANTMKKQLVPPFPVPELKLHFVDMEMLNPSIDQHVYKHDMSDAPDIAKVPHDLSLPMWKDAGVLPFTVEHAYGELVKAIKAGKLKTEKGNEDNAVRWAAFLAHYLEDNTQPLHATEDYKCASYFANRRASPNVHAEIEYEMNDDDKQYHADLREDYWPLLVDDLKTFKDPVTETDPFKATLQVSLASYKQIPLIGLAAMEATGQQGTPDKPKGRAGPIDIEKFFRYSSNVTGTHETVMQMKARQQAWAVVRVAAMWRRAWDAGHGA